MILKKIFLLVIFLAGVWALPSVCFSQQFNLRGTVYDYYNRRPVESVSVFSTSGEKTVSDSMGHYSLRVNNSDSVWFAFFGKNTRKFAVDTISNPNDFEIGLHIDVAWLPSVSVQNKNYRLDSLQNRQDYAKIFNFKKPGLKLSSNPPSTYVPGSVTAGLDLDELINVFRFKRNRQLESFQKRLLQDEQDKYIAHRFSKRFVKQLTKLNSPDLERFMDIYKPDYAVLLLMNELELGFYIQKCFKQFTAGNSVDSIKLSK